MLRNDDGPPGGSGPDDGPVLPPRLQRLSEELAQDAPAALVGAPDPVAALVELSYALRPQRHEGRIPTYGALLVDDGTMGIDDLNCTVVALEELDRKTARRFADGVFSFALRTPSEISHVVCFRRSMGDEGDLIELQQRIGGLVVQRHPRGQVRVFGDAGVVRWDQTQWQHDPPTAAWVERLGGLDVEIPVEAVAPLLGFAMHNLSGRGIGTTLVWQPRDLPTGGIEQLVHHVPPLRVTDIGQQAAVAQAISLTDGAAIFANDGELTGLGARLVPTREAERAVGAYGGTRHTSALRYSFDVPEAFIIVVSEAGPVTIMHAGRPITTIDRADERIG